MTQAPDQPLDPHTENENSKMKVEPRNDTREGQVPALIPRLAIRS